MATGQGSVVIDFGASPGSQEASVAFADAAVGASSKVEPYFMGNDTAGTHTASDHRYVGLFVRLSGVPSAGVGGTIYARSQHRMQGQWAVRYVWAD
jgi:hypothetical protein